MREARSVVSASGNVTRGRVRQKASKNVDLLTVGHLRWAYKSMC